MAKCNLSLEIANPKEQYVPGDTVDVIVHVDTTDSVQCKDLALELGWRTHGTGNRDIGTALTQTLFAGQWSPGEDESYRAQVTIPELSAGFPATYHGRHINVDWHLQARADIPWAIDPKAEARIFVSPNTQDVPDYEYPGIWPTEPVKLAGNSGCLVALMIFTTVGGTVALFYHPLVAVACYVVAAIALAFVLKEKALRERIGEVGFGVSPDRPAIGGELHGFVQISPPGRLDMESVTMTLTGTEVAVSGSGTQQSTHRHVTFTQSATQAEHHTIESGDLLELDFPFQVPVDQPPSFKADNNRVEWALSMEVTVLGAKGLLAGKELTVGWEGRREN